MREYGVATPFAHSCVVWCEYLSNFHHGGRGLAGRVNARLAAQFVWQRIYASVALLAPTQIITVATALLHQRFSWA